METKTNTQTKVRDARTGRLREATGLDRDRVRFNWGYHDGVNEWNLHQGPAPIREANLGPDWKQKHHDPVYVLGFNSGQLDASQVVAQETSQPAWERAQAMGLVGEKEASSDYRVARKAA